MFYAYPALCQFGDPRLKKVKDLWTQSLSVVFIILYLHIKTVRVAAEVGVSRPRDVDRVAEARIHGHPLSEHLRTGRTSWRTELTIRHGDVSFV